MLVGAKQYLRVAVAAEAIAFGVQGGFELRGVIDLSVVNQEIPRILVPHRLRPEGGHILNRQTTVSEAKYRLPDRNYNPAGVVWTTMSLRVEHRSQRQLNPVCWYSTQNRCNATHRLFTALSLVRGTSKIQHYELYMPAQFV